MTKKAKLKKAILVFSLNLFFVISFFFFLEYIVYKIETHSRNKYNEQHNENIKDFYQFRWFHNKTDDPTTISYYEKMSPDKRFRPNFGTEYKKKPILIFGCSYAYGANLKDRETFSYKLSEYTKRPVYNKGRCSWGLQHMLFLLKQDDFYKTIPRQPEYVVYVFLPDHIKRLKRIVYSSLNSGAYLRYELKNNKLTEIKPSWDFLYDSYILNRIYMYVTYKYYLSEQHKEETLQLMDAIFLESKAMIDAHYPNTNFIILYYQDNVNKTAKWMQDEHLFDNLRKKGFIIINTHDLLGRELGLPQDLASDNYHPSSQAWDLIVPKFAKKVNL